MFCHICGTQIAEGAKFCSKCGTKVVYEDSGEVQHEAPDSNDNLVIEDRFNVMLTKVGANKSQLINTVSVWTGAGLKESQELVEKVPVLLKRGVTLEEAEAIKRAFKKVGAEVAFTDQKGHSVEINVLCKVCGAVMDNGGDVCKGCGNRVDFLRSCKISSMKNDSVSAGNDINRKPTKTIFLILAAVIIVVLIRSAVLRNSNYDSDDDMMEYDELVEDYTEDYYGQYQNLDSSLVGRWRSYDGGTLEFSDSGIITSCDFQCWSLKGQKPDLVYWEASNGRVICSAYFYNDFKYRIWVQFEGEKDEREKLNVGGGDSDYYRVSGTYGDIVGEWVSVWSVWWSYQFNEDGSGMWNGRYPITWYTYTRDDGTSALNYTLVDSTYFDYTITGDMLTVFLSNSSRVYTRVGK